MNMQTKKSYEQPELKTLGTYLELTQADNTSPELDGGAPPYICGSVSQLS